MNVGLMDFFVLSFMEHERCEIEYSVFFVFQAGRVQMTLEDGDIVFGL